MRTKTKKAEGLVRSYSRTDSGIDEPIPATVDVEVLTKQFDSEINQACLDGVKVRVTFEWEVPTVWHRIEGMLEAWKKDTFRTFFGCSMPVDSVFIGADLIDELKREDHPRGAFLRRDVQGYQTVKVNGHVLRLLQASRHGELRLAYVGVEKKGE